MADNISYRFLFIFVSFILVLTASSCLSESTTYSFKSDKQSHGTTVDKKKCYNALSSSRTCNVIKRNLVRLERVADIPDKYSPFEMKPQRQCVTDNIKPPKYLSSLHKNESNLLSSSHLNSLTVLRL